jgi:hypothetical protein
MKWITRESVKVDRVAWLAVAFVVRSSGARVREPTSLARRCAARRVRRILDTSFAGQRSEPGHVSRRSHPYTDELN